MSPATPDQMAKRSTNFEANSSRRSAVVSAGSDVVELVAAMASLCSELTDAGGFCAIADPFSILGLGSPIDRAVTNFYAGSIRVSFKSPSLKAYHGG
jgi:hypothetical protein